MIARRIVDRVQRIGAAPKCGEQGAGPDSPPLATSRTYSALSSRAGHPRGALARLLCLMTLTPFALAQIDSPEAALEETVVVASRAPDLIDQIGVSVSTLDRDEMRSFGYPDLGSLLDTQPGVTVTMDGGYGKAAAVRIRGEEGFRTRIVLDGINIADPSSPQISPRIEHLLSSGLSRVEILRGPQGLLWGADAGGVILMSTINDAARTGLDGFAEVGGDGYSQMAVSGVLAHARVTGSMSLARLETDGINARDSDAITRDRDGYENTTLNGALAFQLSDALLLRLSGADISGDNEYDGCYDTQTFALMHDCQDRYDQQSWRTALQWRAGQHQIEFSFASSETDRAFFSAGLPSFSAAGETDTASVIGYWQATNATRLTYGFEDESQRLSDGSANRSRNNQGIYLEAQHSLGAGTYTIGWRRDDNEDFGEYDSWRISARHALPGAAAAWSIRAAIGTGFRAPSLYEIAYNQSPFAAPPATDASLREERSRGWELGLIGQIQTLALEIIWFDQVIDDEIIFDLTSYSGYLQSDGQSTADGIEFIAALPLSDQWRLEGNFTALSAEQQNGRDRPYRPEQSGRLSAVWSQGPWVARLTARHTGEAVDPYQQTIGDTLSVDLTARWQWSPRLSLETRVLNITDQSDQVVPDYRVPGLTAYAGFRLTL